MLFPTLALGPNLFESTRVALGTSTQVMHTQFGILSEGIDQTDLAGSTSYTVTGLVGMPTSSSSGGKSDVMRMRVREGFRVTLRSRGVPNLPSKTAGESRPRMEIKLRTRSVNAWSKHTPTSKR